MEGVDGNCFDTMGAQVTHPDIALLVDPVFAFGEKRII